MMKAGGDESRGDERDPWDSSQWPTQPKNVFRLGRTFRANAFAIARGVVLPGLESLLEAATRRAQSLARIVFDTALSSW
jgi:hypothetical protein